MKVMRIEVEGAEGGACLWRGSDESEKATIMAQDTWGERHFYREASLTSETEQAALARMLQANLDGYRGTAGDVAEYLRVVQLLGA